MNYLGGGDVEALHTPNRGVEAGLLSLRDHGLLRWLLKSPKISRNLLAGSGFHLLIEKVSHLQA